MSEDHDLPVDVRERVGEVAGDVRVLALRDHTLRWRREDGDAAPEGVPGFAGEAVSEYRAVAAGSTGRGEECIYINGAHTIVENMRHGMSPQEAGLDALKRIVRNYNNDMSRLKFLDMTYYILRKDGAYAGVSLWEGYSPDFPHKIGVHDGTARSEKTVALLKGSSQEFPPFPALPAGVSQDSDYYK